MTTPWDRRTFLSAGAASLAAMLAGCGTDSGEDGSTPTNPGSSPSESVIVVGAGAAGMTAAHLLRQRGIDVRLLEASATYGGRIAHDRSFVDFPISLGGEWLHVEREVLRDIVSDASVDLDTELVRYDEADQIAYIDGTDVVMAPLRPEVFDVDTKFVGSSWLDFFETNVVPGIADTMTFETQIIEVDHSGESVVLRDAANVTHSADRVIVTVPLRILQRREVAFVPPLEEDRLEAVDGAVVWSGLKAFFEFSERFYPAAIGMSDSDTPEGQRLFYDAAYGQDSAHHVLGLFSVGAQAERYQAMSDDALVADVLGELDAAFDGAASRSYLRHVVHDWNAQPFAGAAYLEDEASTSVTSRLAEPLSDRVFFAGDAYTTFDDWSSVHAAAWSAVDTVAEMYG